MSSQYGGDDEQGYNIHFFKVILQSTLQDGKLMMPRSFVKQFGEELSNPVILVLPNGVKWGVNCTKRDSDIWFQRGWEKISQHYSLNHGHFLVFRYEGGSQFHVLIFDESALEIDYSTSKRSSNDDEGTNIFHQDAENNYGDTPHHKKMKTNAGSGIEGSVHAKNCSKTVSDRRKNKAHEDIEGSTALEKANRFISDYPFFIRELFQSYIKHVMVVPMWFSKKYMYELEGTATIVVSEENMEKSWPVRFKFIKSGNRAHLSKGWKLVAQECNLKEGDVCVFELIISHRTKFSFKMTIFRDTQLSSSHNHFQE